jgi:signal transduction histidine kinase
LGYRVEGNALVIYVKDTGSGIPDEVRAKLFERGTQGTGGTRGTSGLGLYNARKVIETHKGKIWVESESGKGTTFYFELPLER